MVTQFVLLAIGAYLLGSVPAAYLAVRWSRGTDIRQVGSGNVGASNVLKAGPKWLSIPVALFDIGKAALIVWVAQLLGLAVWQQVMVGLLTIIGHNWSVFLRFRGGRGVFASFGVIVMLSPWLGLIALAFAYSFAPLKQLSLGVLLTFLSLPIFSRFLSAPLGIDIDARLPVTMGMTAILAIGILKRLTAPKTPLSESVSLGGLIVNRLLFDRDIRDRKAWISQENIRADSIEEPIDWQG